VGDCGLKAEGFWRIGTSDFSEDFFPPYPLYLERAPVFFGRVGGEKRNSFLGARGNKEGDSYEIKISRHVLVGPRQLEMQTFDLPKIREDDGLLEVDWSESAVRPWQSMKGGHSCVRPYPIVLGHEIVEGSLNWEKKQRND